jgi:hypothetical protein
MALDVRPEPGTWKKVVRMDLPRQQVVKRLRLAGLSEAADAAEATLPDPVSAEVARQFCEANGLSPSILMDRMGASP